MWQGKKKVKKTGFVYTRLFDGIHPDEKLKAKWFNLLVKTMKTESPQNPLSSSESEQDDSDEDSWDFKRVKTH